MDLYSNASYIQDTITSLLSIIFEEILELSHIILLSKNLKMYLYIITVGLVTYKIYKRQKITISSQPLTLSKKSSKNSAHIFRFQTKELYNKIVSMNVRHRIVFDTRTGNIVQYLDNHSPGSRCYINITMYKKSDIFHPHVYQKEYNLKNRHVAIIFNMNVLNPENIVTMEQIKKIEESIGEYTFGYSINKIKTNIYSPSSYYLDYYVSGEVPMYGDDDSSSDYVDDEYSSE